MAILFKIYLVFHSSMVLRCSSSQLRIRWGPSCWYCSKLSVKTQANSKMRLVRGSRPLISRSTHRQCGTKLTLISNNYIKCLYRVVIIYYHRNNTSQLIFSACFIFNWVQIGDLRERKRRMGKEEGFGGKGHQNLVHSQVFCKSKKKNIHKNTYFMFPSIMIDISFQSADHLYMVRALYQNCQNLVIDWQMIEDSARYNIQVITLLQMMSQGYQSSPSSCEAWPCLSPSSALQLPDCLDKDCENSSSTQADSDSITSLELPVDETESRPLRPRTQDQIRLRYFQKLQGDGLLSQRPRKKCHHLIILDWDDTLLCTTYLASNRIDHPSQLAPAVATKIKEMDYKVAKLLTTALELANVQIVTNSLPGWVHYSARTFLPQALRVIQAFKVEVVSARAAYEDIFPGDPQKWKTECFRDQLQNLEKRTVALNFVCIGDSKYQIEAAEKASMQFQKRFVKTIKLKQKPKVEDLCKQLHLVQDKLRELIKQTKSLVIKLEKK